MAMSVGICECGCSEFGHDVGGLWEELSEPEYEGWQRHRCTKQCSEPCLVARCRDSFDGDGFWVWCRECDIQCSGSFESWSDDPEEGIEFESSSNTDRDDVPQGVSWPPQVGERISVNFTPEELLVSEWVVINDAGDPVRAKHATSGAHYQDVYALYCLTQAGDEALVLFEDLCR